MGDRREILMGSEIVLRENKRSCCILIWKTYILSLSLSLSHSVASNGSVGHSLLQEDGEEKQVDRGNGGVGGDSNRGNSIAERFKQLSSSERNISEGDVSIVGLKRRVGFVSGTALIVGTMIGSGIFVSPKGVLQRSGSVGLSLIVWIGSGLISLLGKLLH